MDMDVLQRQVFELEAALKEANDENVELRGELSQVGIPSSFAFFTLICIQPQNRVMVYPIPDNIVGRAKLIEVLRQAAEQILESMK